jgi:hypothetical protein
MYGIWHLVCRIASRASMYDKGVLVLLTVTRPCMCEDEAPALFGGGHHLLSERRALHLLNVLQHRM